MIHISTLLQHYKRDDVQEEIIANAADREIAVKFGDSGFGKRPDVLNYKKDIMEFAKQGATSFHASEERWSNPLSLDVSMRRQDQDSLRKGWDLVLDIDCHELEYSKLAADLCIKALKYHKISSISCKFSGNKGFHIGVPFEAFPETIGDKEMKELFPEAARKIAFYIKEMIKKPLGEKIMEYENADFGKILEKTGLVGKENEVLYYKENSLGTKIPLLNAEPFLDIDTVLISSRHLYRMPYSFNEKSGLISIPIDPKTVLQFKREDAKHPIKVSTFRFLDTRTVEKGEAKNLLVQAFDSASKKEKEQEEKEGFKPTREFSIPETAIPEKFFPPCIQKGLAGLKDGRKRFLFVIVNFLVNVGWDYEQIEKLLIEWNKKNFEPLRENYIVGHLRYHKTRKEKILPPNCNSEMYYGYLGEHCKTENFHAGIKNPVQYAKKKARYAQRVEDENAPKKRRKKKDEDDDLE